jgi:hypothetical protein
MNSILLTLACLLGIAFIVPKLTEVEKIPTKIRIVGKWQNRYDSTDMYIFSQQKCTSIQKGVQIFSETYVVCNQPPIFVREKAKVDEFGAYLWLEGKAHEADITNPKYINVVFKKDGSLQLGTENPGTESCLNDDFGFGEYDKIPNIAISVKKSK